jgi:BAI1-associated protein 3
METGQFPGVQINHWTVLDGDREPADTKPFEIYFAFLEFAKLKQHLSVTPQPPEKTLGLQNYHEWFEAALQRWLTVSKAKTLQRVRTALALDQICEGEKIVRHSTSSVDIASCFYQLREFWRLLAWPEPNTSVHFEAQIIEAACSAAMHYADLIHQKLADSGYYEQTGPFRTTDEMCVTVNNLEYVRRALSEFRPETHCVQDVAADNLLESSLVQLEARSDRVLNKLGTSMQAPLQKAVFHLAWSPDSLPANQAIVPLLEYLDVHLSTLNSALLTKNFNRALTLIWSAVLHELSRQMDTGGDTEKPANFHDRLYDALQLMVDFFNAEGLGLPLEVLHCEAYWRVKQRLQYHKTDTERLIDMFYLQRLQEQLTAISPGPYGTLAVRAYFNHDSLCVEILHARDVIPLDPNGFSDPFVIIEMLPRRIFAHCAEQQTNVHKVSVISLMINEKFTWFIYIDM